MAITEVGSGSQRAAGGNNNSVAAFAALAFPASVASGSLLVAAGAAWGSTAAPTSIAVTDTRGTPYTVALGTVPGGFTWRTFIAYGIAPSSGANSVTVNPAGADGTHSGSFSIDEFTALPNTIVASVNGGTTTGITAVDPTVNITTATAGELIIGVMSHDGGSAYLATAGTGPSSGTAIGLNDVNSANQCHWALFEIAGAAGTYDVTWDTANPLPTGAIQRYSFKEEAGGGGGPEDFVLVAN